MQTGTGSGLAHKGALALGAGLVMANRILIRAGLRRRADGWRRGAGLVLRQEPATFVLSALGLQVWSDMPRNSVPSIEATRARLALRLARFLTEERDARVSIRRGELEDRAETCGSASYTLAFQEWVEGPGRFVRPEHWVGRDCREAVAGKDDASTEVLLNIVCRIDASGNADLWMRVNHIGADGVPMQEMLSRLETQWGVDEVIYPTPEEFESFAGPRRCGGAENLAEMQAFVEFGPLLAWRKRQNAMLPEPLTVSSATLWCLARHESWSKLHMGTTVGVPEVQGLGRGVGVVVVRPANYVGRADGLARYARDFNRQLELTRRRESDAFKTLDAAALIGPKLATKLLRCALEDGGKAFGSIALTVLREARIFGAPLGDAGHADGFLALGSVDLPTGDERKVGCVTIKGPVERIREYPRMLREAVRGLDQDDRRRSTPGKIGVGIQV